MSIHLQLRVNDIVKSYEGNTVLKGCSFHFEKSGVYILMGPNGSGKSTFFRICALLEDPDSGEISYLYHGKKQEENITLKRTITLLLPKVGVFNTSVINNIAYGLKLRGIHREEAHTMLNEVTKLVGLIHKKNQNALTLSSGEMQRLGIARALAIKPKILFLDEPTASVDPKNVEIIEEVILKMKQEKKSIIILATHDQSQAKRLGDCLISISDGVLKQ
jgi:tungstate transport system ATP-binding protein